MARGFESKGVEAQQEEAARRRGRQAGTAPSAAEREAAERRRTLELARARTDAQLASATHPAHRQMLLGALAAIDAQLAALPGEPS